MSLEVVNTLASLTTVVIVAATAIAALVQLRHLNAGNQINAMLAIGQELGAREFRDAAQLVRQELEEAFNDLSFRDFVVAAARNQAQPEINSHYMEMQRASLMVGNAYEELGILVKRGIVDKEMFLDRYAWVILANWKKLERPLAFSREAAATDLIWENFEYLAVLAEDWIMGHARGTYPQGVRRMQLTNPWPIVTPATA